MSEQLIQIAEFNPENPFIYKGICFDPLYGAGNIPALSNINHKGFVAFIEPEAFLACSHTLELVYTRPTLSFMTSLLPGGDFCIAPPSLWINDNDIRPWPGESPSNLPKYYIGGHEGRHRVTALKNLGLELVPVFIFLRFLNSQSVTADFLTEIRLIYSENNSWEWFIPKYYVIQKKVYVDQGRLFQSRSSKIASSLCRILKKEVGGV